MKHPRLIQFAQVVFWVVTIGFLVFMGNRAFSTDTYAQDSSPSQNTNATSSAEFAEELATSTDKKKVNEEPPDCTDPGNWGHPACRGYKTPTPEPTDTPTPKPTATNTPKPTATNTPEPTATDTPTPPVPPTPKPTDTPMVEPTATDTPTRPRSRVTGSITAASKTIQLYQSTTLSYRYSPSSSRVSLYYSNAYVVPVRTCVTAESEARRAIEAGRAIEIAPSSTGRGSVNVIGCSIGKTKISLRHNGRTLDSVTVTVTDIPTITPTPTTDPEPTPTDTPVPPPPPGITANISALPAIIDKNQRTTVSYSYTPENMVVHLHYSTGYATPVDSCVGAESEVRRAASGGVVPARVIRGRGSIELIGCSAGDTVVSLRRSSDNRVLASVTVTVRGSTPPPPPPTPTDTPIPTPVPTPKVSLFSFNVERVELLDGESILTRIDSDDLDWRVLQRRRVNINVIPKSNVNIDDYEFNLMLHSGKTGFYNMTGGNKGTCRPLGSDESDWFSGSLKRLRVIRCNVGDGAKGFELKVRREVDEVEVQRISTGPIHLAYHVHSDTTTYYADLTASWGSRPSFVPSEYTALYRDMLPKGLKIAADRWNATRSSPFLAPHSGGGVPGITMFGYWDGGSDCPDAALACVHFGITPHPHIFNTSIAVRLPPAERNSEGYLVAWTNDIDLALYEDPTKGYQSYYLPHVIMHEIGHTMGLGHDLPKGNVMTPKYGPHSTISFPTSDDRIGMNAVLDPH